MRTELPDPLVRTEGAAEWTPTPDGLHPSRLPAWTRPRITDPFMNLVVEASAGARLRLRTSATSVSLRVRTTRSGLGDRVLPASFDLTVDGEVLDRRTSGHGDVMWLAEDPSEMRFEPGGPETITFAGLPGGDKDVEIWLPHGATCAVSAVETDAPLLAPSEPAGPRWVHHGSSISHGLEAPAPTLAWPGAAAVRAGAPLTNLGFAGNAVLDPDVARTIAATPADLVTLELGINLVDGALMRERTFVPAVHGFLDLIREGHPGVPVVVVSPVSCPVLETTPGPTERDPATGRIRALGSPGRGALTVSGVRELLAAVVDGRGDPALRYLDGRELFGPDEAAGSLPDGLHPDPAAHLRMAERATHLLLGERVAS